MDNLSVDGFVNIARSIVGLDASSPFSLEDVHTVADRLGLDGLLYLEKLAETRHVNVLFDLGEDSAVLYDPISGPKTKACNEIQIGLYCVPVGRLRGELLAYERKFENGGNPDIWDQYARRGRLILDFLAQHVDFPQIFGESISIIADRLALQNTPRSSDCAPISLFTIFVCNSMYEQHRTKQCEGRRVRAAATI